jgi:hypothetical protein
MLAEEQQKTFNTPRMKYGLVARMLFRGMDLVYGRKRTLAKFKVLEVIARMPYQAWENLSYAAMTLTYSQPAFARRIFDVVLEAREQQDNEQWHLLIIMELLRKKKAKLGVIRFRILPQVVAFLYYHISRLLYVARPSSSYKLNAHFEDHAEHEYMSFVAENPELEQEGYHGDFAADYGHFETLADLFRQVAIDERHHKDLSLKRVKAVRFGSEGR